MKTEMELMDDILSITMKINNTYPELVKYLGEMPVRIPANNDSGINYANLKSYYDSLTNLLNRYAVTHNYIFNQVTKH